MIKTPLSTVIGGAFWTPGATVINGAKLSFEIVMKKLFANGEQGFWYDPNDMGTMFQDAAGTVPVTAVGQPVGLVIDKSKGLVLGSERVVNGNFDDLSSWSDYSSPIKSVQNGILKLEAKPQGSSGIHQDIPLPNHSTCKVVVRARKVSGASSARILIMPRTGDFSATALVEITGDSFKDYTFYITKEAAATGIRVYLQIAASDAVLEVDSVSVKGIAGNHAYQATSASRPVLRQNAVTGAYYLEFDGSDDFLQTNNIDFTATDKVSLFAGVRKLSDAATGIVCELSSSLIANNGTFYLLAPTSYGIDSVGFTSKGTLASGANTTGYVSPASLVITGQSSISTPLSRLRINGVIKLTSTASQGTGNYGNYPLYIGRRGGTSLPFNGHIYSLIGVGRLTTDSETAAIEKELAKRTGVTLSV